RPAAQRRARGADRDRPQRPHGGPLRRRGLSCLRRVGLHYGPDAVRRRRLLGEVTPMKALLYTGPHTLEWREQPEPTPRNDEVVVRVDAVGICGSDMHAYHGQDTRRAPPLVLGHEAAGRIVSGPNAGARVAVNPMVTCGACDWCLDGRVHLCPSRQLISMPPRPGALAELVRVPERNLVPVPDRLDVANAAPTP